MSLEKPRLFKIPFAGEAESLTINTVPDVPNPNDIATKPSLAAYSTGFPARSMQPPQAGGRPFYGQDVNGVLRDITANIQYVQAGNYYPYDAEFQKAVGGYNKFAVVLNPDDGKLYQSLIDANTAPLSDTKSWFFFTDGKYLPLTGGELSGRLAIRNDQNSDITLEKQSGDKAGYTIQRKSDDLFIYSSKNGVVNDNYITKYDKSTDTWDFNTAGLTKNGVPVVIENQVLGIGQKWFDMTSKRKNNVEYTNNTGKVIALSLWQSDRPDSSPNSNILIDGLKVCHNDWSIGGNTAFTLVPPGSVYKTVGWNNYPWRSRWLEFRDNDE